MSERKSYRQYREPVSDGGQLGPWGEDWTLRFFTRKEADMALAAPRLVEALSWMVDPYVSERKLEQHWRNALRLLDELGEDIDRFKPREDPLKKYDEPAHWEKGNPT